MCAWRAWVYAAGAIVVAALTAAVAVGLPETRGVHVDAMPGLWAAHPLWRRFAEEKGGGGVEGGDGGDAPKRARWRQPA